MRSLPPDIIIPRGIGYWKSSHELTLPDPNSFVNLDIPAEQRTTLIEYLESGIPYIRYLGYSFCRFGCDDSITKMGAADLTDGTYTWPEGLSHYIKEHGVWLPDEFIEHTVRNAGFNEQSVKINKIGIRDLTWWQSINR